MIQVCMFILIWMCPSFTYHPQRLPWPQLVCDTSRFRRLLRSVCRQRGSRDDNVRTDRSKGAQIRATDAGSEPRTWLCPDSPVLHGAMSPGERDALKLDSSSRLQTPKSASTEKGQMGSALMGSLQMLCLLAGKFSGYSR